MRGILTAIEARRPESVTELLAILAAQPSLRPIAGGTDVMVRIEAGLDGDQDYVDLSGLAAELRYARLDRDALRIGALATFWDLRTAAEAIAAFPLLEEAARTVGAAQIQNRGTWAGNIANGSPAADGVAALLAYDAEVTLESIPGRRTVPLHGFFTGYKKMDLRPGEFVREIALPRKGTDLHHAFHKVGTRRAQAITKVGLILNHRADTTWRIVGVSLAPFVTRYPAIEAVLNAGGRIARDGLRRIVGAEVKPIDDLRSTATYRKRVFLKLLESELERCGAGLG